MKFKACVLQFEVKEGDFESNYRRFLKLQQMCDSASLIVAPELFLTGFFYRDMNSAFSFSKTVLNEISKLSKERSLTLVFSVVEKVNSKFFNCVKVLDRGKEVLSRPKVKLFLPTKEHEYFAQGSMEDVKIAPTSCGNLAPVVCFELRFSEIFVRLKRQGAQVYTLCAQWGRARKEHWKLLTAARAVETQRFVVASNATGTMAGNSVIVDPWGRVLKSCADAEGIAMCEVDTDFINTVERKLPMG
jgi:predicted amidohydrolase